MADEIGQINLLFVLLALIGGFLPTIFWLWFWLQEDKKKPEPARLILKTFIVGGFFIIPAFALEKLLAPNADIATQILDAYRAPVGWSALVVLLSPLLIWALIEESTKYLASYVGALKNKKCDEPIDMMIYLITAALGFAAVENFLFLLNVLVLVDTGPATFLFTGQLRFLGATLLHTVTSAILGAFLGLSFYQKNRLVKFLAGSIGLITASILHVVFNFFIIINEGGNVLRVLICLWAIAVVVIFLFEIIKRLNYSRIYV